MNTLSKNAHLSTLLATQGLTMKKVLMYLIAGTSSISLMGMNSQKQIIPIQQTPPAYAPQSNSMFNVVAIQSDPTAHMHHSVIPAEASRKCSNCATICGKCAADCSECVVGLNQLAACLIAAPFVTCADCCRSCCCDLDNGSSVDYVYTDRLHKFCFQIEPKPNEVRHEPNCSPRIALPRKCSGCARGCSMFGKDTAQCIVGLAQVIACCSLAPFTVCADECRSCWCHEEYLRSVNYTDKLQNFCFCEEETK